MPDPLWNAWRKQTSTLFWPMLVICSTLLHMQLIFWSCLFLSCLAAESDIGTASVCSYDQNCVKTIEVRVFVVAVFPLFFFNRTLGDRGRRCSGRSRTFGFQIDCIDESWITGRRFHPVASKQSVVERFFWRWKCEFGTISGVFGVVVCEAATEPG